MFAHLSVVLLHTDGNSVLTLNFLVAVMNTLDSKTYYFKEQLNSLSKMQMLKAFVTANRG